MINSNFLVPISLQPAWFQIILTIQSNKTILWIILVAKMPKSEFVARICFFTNLESIRSMMRSRTRAVRKTASVTAGPRLDPSSTLISLLTGAETWRGVEILELPSSDTSTRRFEVSLNGIRIDVELVRIIPRISPSSHLT